MFSQLNVPEIRILNPFNNLTLHFCERSLMKIWTQLNKKYFMRLVKVKLSKDNGKLEESMEMQKKKN